MALEDQTKAETKTADKPYTEVLPPEGDDRVGPKIFQITSEVIQEKVSKGLHDKWLRNYELTRNKHWKDTGTAAVPLVSANLIHVHITKTVNSLCTNNPTFNIAKLGEFEDEQSEAFDMLQRTAEFWWTDQEQQHYFRRSVLQGEKYGPAIEKMVFNPELELGIGEAETVNVDPFQFGWYPVKMSDPRNLQKCSAVLHYYPMTIDEVKRLWPDKADQIKPDSEYLKHLGQERYEVNTASEGKFKGIMVTAWNTVMQLLNKWGGVDSETDETLVIECWCKDRTTDEQGKAKYPGYIRCVTVCSGGEVVLSDRPNPNINPDLPIEQAAKTYLFDKYPFSLANSAEDDASAWGLSDIEQLEKLNIEYNKSLSQLVLYKDKAARLKIINPLTSGVKNEDLVNYPSILNPVNAEQGNGIHYLEVPPAPLDLMETLNIFKEIFFTVAQTFEVEQAHAPGRDVIAYKAIAALIEQASIMMKGKIDGYSRLLRERGRMYISMVQNFYTEDRYITFRDKDGIDATKKIRGTELIIPAKLTVVTGSTMPTSKVQQREEAIELRKAGSIDDKALLDALEYPGRNDIIKRMELGLLGQLLNKLSSVGMPQPYLQYIQQVAEVDEKQLKPKVEKQELPPFEMVHQNFMQQMAAQQGQQPAQGPTPEESKMLAEAKKSDAEIQKILADAEKIMRERDLTTEKINTEKVEQRVKLAGIGYDEETIKMSRAKLVKELLNQEHTQDIEKAGALVDAETKLSPRNETKGTPPYREKGLKSNNES